MAGLDDVLASVATWIESNLLLDTVRVTLPDAGDPVLDQATGKLTYPDGTVLYEGSGSVLTTSAMGELPGVADANLPWTGSTRSRYRMLTPLDAPLVPKDATITVVAVHNPANTSLIGRSWICTDPSRVSTVEAVRITSLDQNPEPRQAP